MTRSTATRVAWSSWAVSLVLALASVVLLVLTRAVPIPRGAVPRAMFAAWILVLVILSTMGALIVARQSANRIGWSFVAAGLGAALQVFATQYAIYALLIDPGSLPGGAWAAWLAVWPVELADHPGHLQRPRGAAAAVSHRSAVVASLAAGGLDGGRLDRRGGGGQLHLPT